MVGSKNQIGRKVGERVRMSWYRVSGSGLAEPELQGKDWTRKKNRDNMGLRFTIDLLFPKCLSHSRAMVMLCRLS